MCFFQEKFQESLKKLRQEQQEAEKLAAVIREKRISWKVRDSSEGVLEQKSSQGMGAEAIQGCCVILFEDKSKSYYSTRTILNAIFKTFSEGDGKRILRKRVFIQDITS